MRRHAHFKGSIFKSLSSVVISGGTVLFRGIINLLRRIIISGKNLIWPGRYRYLEQLTRSQAMRTSVLAVMFVASVLAAPVIAAPRDARDVVVRGGRDLATVLAAATLIGPRLWRPLPRVQIPLAMLALTHTLLPLQGVDLGPCVL